MNQLTLFDYQQKLNNVYKYVRQITYEETKPFLLNIHYARRMPSISFAFGLFVDGDLIGIVTYGVPASNSLCRGIAGEENTYNVLELNRLCLLPKYNGENYASYLVARSLKLLPNHTFVVSYADTAWTHVGYIYQATNFIYTGATKERTDIYANGGHSRHYDKQENRRQFRSSKHRYVYLVGDKRTRKQMLKELRYPIVTPYPKGEEVKYDIDNPQAIEPIKVIGDIS